MKFKVLAVKHVLGSPKLAEFTYDNDTSELRDRNGVLIVDDAARAKIGCASWGVAEATSEQSPLGKLTRVRDLKIQLGLQCNYSCTYCSQRFVERAETGGPSQAEVFMNNLDTWLDGSPEKIELWGGEPFVYWKTLRPLGEALRERFPDAQIMVITNGSLLNEEINDWIERLGVCVGVSHDGPGQHVRGPDPLEDPEKRRWVIDLWRRLSPVGKISFNPMTNRLNMDRGKIQEFFRELLGTDEFLLGEGDFIDAYDEGGSACSMQSREEHLGFRRLTLAQTRAGQNDRLEIVNRRVAEWVNSISTQRPSSSLWQKCGMDRLDTLAVDLKGNVITCQNVSAAAVAPNGRGHKIGHVSRMDRVALRTSTHWSERPGCPTCPMLQLCKGSCMFLEDELFKRSCDSSYSDHVPFFAVAIERLTGYLPFRIEPLEGSLPEDRADLWGRPDEEGVVP